MKKRLALVLAALATMAMLAGCGGDTSTDNGGDASTGGADGEGYTSLQIIAAHGAAENTSENESFLKFKELIEERSGGAVTLTCIPTSSWAATVSTPRLPPRATSPWAVPLLLTSPPSSPR